MNSAPLTFIDGRITIDPAICNGKPTIRGKRITVQTVLEYLSADDSAEDILQQYPGLETGDIQACLRFAVDLMEQHYSLTDDAEETEDLLTFLNDLNKGDWPGLSKEEIDCYINEERSSWERD